MKSRPAMGCGVRLFVSVSLLHCFILAALILDTPALSAQGVSRKNGTPVEKRLGDLEKNVMRLQQASRSFYSRRLPTI